MTEYAIDIKYGFTDAQTAEIVKPGTVFSAKLKLAPYEEPVPEIWQKVLEGKL